MLQGIVIFIIIVISYNLGFKDGVRKTNDRWNERVDAKVADLMRAKNFEQSRMSEEECILVPEEDFFKTADS